MTFKELTAVIQLTSVVVVSGWVYSQATGNPELAGNIPAIAAMLVWAIGLSIAFNIVAIIVGTIIVSIARGETVKDEADDERDRAVADKSMRNGYAVSSVVAALALVALGFAGLDPVFTVYALFAAPLLGGAVDAGSRLVYYRIG